MDVILIGISAFSLVLALAMGVVLLKQLREERRRQDARVALLMAAAARVEPSLPLRSPAAAVISPPRPVALQAELFTTPDAPSPWRQRALAAAAVGVVVLAAGYVLLPSADRSATVARAAAQAAPLELLALRHTREADGLTISGVVQNPRNGAAVSRVAATVFLFGPDGSMITSARAGLDYTTLAPGDESPFVVKAPAAAAVARYRVGFRAADGSAIAHVDKRGDATSARNRTQGITP